MEWKLQVKLYIAVTSLPERLKQSRRAGVRMHTIRSRLRVPSLLYDAGTGARVSVLGSLGLRSYSMHLLLIGKLEKDYSNYDTGNTASSHAWPRLSCQSLLLLKSIVVIVSVESRWLMVHIIMALASPP